MSGRTGFLTRPEDGSGDPSYKETKVMVSLPIYNKKGAEVGIFDDPLIHDSTSTSRSTDGTP